MTKNKITHLCIQKNYYNYKKYRVITISINKIYD